MKQQKKSMVLTVTFIFGEAAALAVVLAVLVMFVWMSLSGSYEILVCTNSYGEHYTQLTLMCVIVVLVTVDLICRLARLRKEVISEHGR